MESRRYKARATGIDPLFSSRRRPTDIEIEEIIDRFATGGLNSLEVEAALARLALVKKRILSRLLKMVASPDPSLHQPANSLLQKLELTQAIKPLRGLLEDPSVEDDHKMSVLQTLHTLGGFAAGEDPFVYLHNPAAVIRKAQDSFLEFLQDPLQLEIMLESTLEGGASSLTQDEMLNAMAYTQDRRILPFFLCLLHAPSDGVVLGVIAALQAMQDPAIRPILEERACYDPSEQVRQAARQAAMSLSGQQKTPRISILELPVAPPALKRCLLSTIDGDGGQLLVVIRQSPGGRSCVFWHVMMDDHEGIKDCFGGQAESVGAVEAMINDGMAEMGLELVEVSLQRVREELRAAYQLTLRCGRRLPTSYMAWQPWQHGDDPEPVSDFPLPELPSEEWPALLARSGELLALEEFGSWYFGHEELGGLKRKLLQTLQYDDATVDHLVSQGIKQIVRGTRRRRLRQRLRRQAWLLAQVYEDAEIPKLALAAAVGLDDGHGRSLVQHPLLREMMLRSLTHALGLEA